MATFVSVLGGALGVTPQKQLSDQQTFGSKMIGSDT
jgi:hypothetical protein